MDDSLLLSGNENNSKTLRKSHRRVVIFCLIGGLLLSVCAAFVFVDRISSFFWDGRRKNSAYIISLFESNIKGSSSPRELLVAVIRSLENTREIQAASADLQLNDKSVVEYPYYLFIPTLAGSILPVKENATSLNLRCFPRARGFLVKADEERYKLRLELGKATHAECSELLLFATVGSIQTHTVKKNMDLFIWKNKNYSQDPLQWDFETKGIRIFRFHHPTAVLLYSIGKTAALFRPLLQKSPDSFSENINLHFLKNYRGVVLGKRIEPHRHLQASEVDDGDVLSILRLDGLDPLVAWGTGSVAGHAAIALHREGELFILESTVKSSHWPTNGLQKTPFADWMSQAKTAGFHVVLHKLSKLNQQRLKVMQIWSWFDSFKGVDYGYENFLFVWIDTLKDNFPCLPPSFRDQCLAWPLLEVMAGNLYRLAPTIIGRLFVPAWNKRLATVGLSPAELFQLASRRLNSSDFRQLNVIPENDMWMYNTTKRMSAFVDDKKPVEAPIVVCSSFVCRLLKEGRIFDNYVNSSNAVNCAEFNNYDIYSMRIYNASSQRQILGRYELKLNDFNSRTPMNHMAETCPSKPPLYRRPSSC